MYKLEISDQEMLFLKTILQVEKEKNEKNIKLFNDSEEDFSVLLESLIKDNGIIKKLLNQIEQISNQEELSSVKTIGEDKQRICDLLTDTLKATNNLSDLVNLRYVEKGPDKQEVVAIFEGGSKVVDVSFNSGTSMIRNVIKKIL